jgi:hypothetical protein
MGRIQRTALLGLMGPPNAPNALSATSVTETSFTARWQAVTGATGYRLDVSTNINFSSFLSGYNNLSLTTTTRSVTGLTQATTYYYRVRAVNSIGTSGNSNTIEQTTPGWIQLLNFQTWNVNDFAGGILQTSTGSTHRIVGTNSVTSNQYPVGFASSWAYQWAWRGFSYSGHSQIRVRCAVIVGQFIGPVNIGFYKNDASTYAMHLYSNGHVDFFKAIGNADGSMTSMYGYNQFTRPPGSGPSNAYYYEVVLSSGGIITVNCLNLSLAVVNSFQITNHTTELTSLFNNMGGIILAPTEGAYYLDDLYIHAYV